jgi:hypothetical protein
MWMNIRARSFLRRALLGLGLAALALTPFARPAEAARPVAKKSNKLVSPYKPRLKKLDVGPIVDIEYYGRNYAHMTEAAYADLRNVMMVALKKYNPKTHYFVGLGSDPAPLIAFLQNLGGHDMAINFPASGKGYAAGVAPEIMKPYVKKLFPKGLLESKKTIVLVDQTSSGGTLQQLGPIFRTYLKSVGLKNKVVQLAFSRDAQPAGNEHIDTTQFGEVNNFLYAPYEDVTAQYPGHYLGTTDIKELVERQQYRDFKGAMRKRMQRDKTLDKFITQLNRK